MPQTKLAISTPGDQYEQEADRVAGQVMRMPDPVLQRQSKSSPDASNFRNDEAPQINRQTNVAGVGGEVASDFTSGLGSGLPLDTASRAYFETRFGHDFSDVRVHSSGAASRSAEAIGARAYTFGHDVVFAAAEHDPGSESGRRLLAHELAHVVQQGSSGGNSAAKPALIQRACGPEEIGEVGGCIGRSEAPVGERFLFRVRCDRLLPGELTRLVDFSRTISNGDRLIIHGNASEEGDERFNENLSCQRARMTQAMLAYALGLRGVSASFLLIKHSEIEGGSRRRNRSVVIDWIPAEPSRPTRTERPQSDRSQPDAGPPSATDAGPRPDIDAGAGDGGPEEIDATDLDAGPPSIDAGFDAGTNAVAPCARSANCPAEFCLPFPTRTDAESDRAARRSTLLSAAASHLTDGGATEVRNLFAEFLDGGQPHRDLSSRLASFFMGSVNTGNSLRFLERELEAYFRANPPPSGGSRTVNIGDAIPTAIAALGRMGDPNVMRFDNPTETPGRLAGGVSRGQAACRVGAMPSSVEDGRTASGTAIGTNSGGRILVTSSIQFSVTDTIDFCPGNCGGSFARDVTVPLSRYEATGISGDVPFTVTFSAPVGAFDSEEW